MAKSCADGADRRSFLAGDARAEAEHRASERLPLTIRRQWEATIVLRGELRQKCDRGRATAWPGQRGGRARGVCKELQHAVSTALYRTMSWSARESCPSV